MKQDMNIKFKGVKSMSKNYEDFIKSKIIKIKDSGFKINESELNKNLFDFQKHIVKKALQKGRYAIFADCGLGKTLMQLDWAYQVSSHTNKPVLILCPLAVSAQTIEEGKKFGIEVNRIGYGNIQITNYEQVKNLDCSIYSGIVLDESSILKNYSGAIKNLIIESFQNTQYKLACTATPSPNDELEIGNHAEFLNIMTLSDMRSLFFVTDKELIKTKNKYRLKKHAHSDFYSWISSWATMISNPSDIGFNHLGYDLPKLNYVEKRIITENRESDRLFNSNSVSATKFNQELRLTKIERLSEVISIVNGSNESFIIWIKHNEEGEYLKKLIPDSMEVSGSDKIEYKEKTLLDFSKNKFRVLITKTEIAQFGLNFQNCNNQVFASLDFSFEGLYQAIRRSYRFGQKKEVNIYLITTDTMENVIDSINEKEKKFKYMQSEMIKKIKGELVMKEEKQEKIYENDSYRLILGDCVEMYRDIESESIGYTFFSPPFKSMYVFSNDPKDMSNIKDDTEFYEHFRFLVKELSRVTKKGRLVSLHIMQGTTLLGRDGFYSIVDFRGDLIRLFQDEGFYFHAENMIRKDPKTAAIRTKNHQLMHGTTKRDSAIVRPGLADYILTFRKPGENKEPIQNNIPFELWCEIAEPVWLTIDEGDTLEYRSAKTDKDERHLTPTQLKPIEWCYMIWSNENDWISCPFMGIGSEGYIAMKMNRKFIGIELKESYYELAVKNISSVAKERSLF